MGSGQPPTLNLSTLILLPISYGLHLTLPSPHPIFTALKPPLYTAPCELHITIPDLYE